MSTERFNRQFILLDFEDLDNPEFMEFVRSPEFSTYLILRRYIWRSDRPHTMGLHEYYAQGLLACSLSREKIAETLGGVSPRQVTRDISSLMQRKVIRAIATGRGNVFILGKWAIDEEEDVYYEYFFLDRLQSRVDNNVQTDETSDQDGQKRPDRVDKNLSSEEKDLSSNNIESNSRRNRESSISSKNPSTKKSSANLHSSWIETVIETCTREFRDIEHLTSNIARAYNLWAQTNLNEEEVVSRLQEARRITKERISLSAVHDREKKMAYFFAVLEDVLGLKGRG